MMKNQLAGLMKQAQTMQENMKQAQEAIAAMEVEGEAGGGMVKIVMTGRHDVKRVTIAPTLLAEDKDMLEDLVAAAMNDASTQAAMRTSIVSLRPARTIGTFAPSTMPAASAPLIAVSVRTISEPASRPGTISTSA